MILGKPDVVVATGHLTNELVDKSAVVTLSYKEKAQMATIIMSSMAKLPGELRLIGTQGTLQVHIAEKLLCEQLAWN